MEITSIRMQPPTARGRPATGAAAPRRRHRHRGRRHAHASPLRGDGHGRSMAAPLSVPSTVLTDHLQVTIRDSPSRNVPDCSQARMVPDVPKAEKVFPVPEVFPSDGVFPCSLFPIGIQSMPVPDGKMRVPNG